MKTKLTQRYKNYFIYRVILYLASFLLLTEINFHRSVYNNCNHDAKRHKDMKPFLNT